MSESIELILEQLDELEEQERHIKEADFEIDRLSKEVTMYDELLCNRNNEIDRLNNIINELEKWLENEIKFRKVVGKDFELRKALNVLQILKGSDK